MTKVNERSIMISLIVPCSSRNPGMSTHRNNKPPNRKVKLCFALFLIPLAGSMSVMNVRGCLGQSGQTVRRRFLPQSYSNSHVDLKSASSAGWATVRVKYRYKVKIFDAHT